mmetsp:Transcript_39765/g.106014  ORF Transcript_39765/g.106014 Transcript_39765/m.106014 type:complete len:1097 (+) Transcript_39765:356-3646(+)
MCEGGARYPGTILVGLYRPPAWAEASGPGQHRFLYFVDDVALEALGSGKSSGSGHGGISGSSSGLAGGVAGGVAGAHPNAVSSGVLRWGGSEVRRVSKRMFQLQQVAVEIVCRSGVSALLLLSDVKSRDRLVSVLAAPLSSTGLGAASSGGMGGAVAALLAAQDILGGGDGSGGGWIIETPEIVRAAREQAMRDWVAGMISNFDYLMELNRLAGRTFNDLQQYPVFPWVVADYESDELDLTSPSTFRDLSKPMGALTAVRAVAASERYEDMADAGGPDDGALPPFHHGSHYSTAGHILHYLVRIEPFTSWHLNLQSGRFDLPDRLFHSISESWASASGDGNLSDVRELTPEFYCLPEFLVNSGGLALGKRDGDGVVVDNVILPPWAHGDAREFVRLHRAALESPYVSARLHHWVDLVFGHKQRGEPAIKALNVFYYLTYEGAVDVEAIEEPAQREAVVAQIANFGQTPRQLFKRPHPARAGAAKPITVSTHPELLSVVGGKDTGTGVGDILFPANKCLQASLGLLLLPPSGEFCVFPHRGRPGSLAAILTDGGRPVGVLDGLHSGVITSLGAASRGGILATGGDDGCVKFWDVSDSGWLGKAPRILGADRGAPGWGPLAGCMCGAHSGKVTAIAVAGSAMLALSGGEEGSVLRWDLTRPGVRRRLRPSHGEAVVGAAGDDNGELWVTCSASVVRAWSGAGQVLASVYRFSGSPQSPIVARPVQTEPASESKRPTARTRADMSWEGFGPFATACAVRYAPGEQSAGCGLVVTGHADGAIRLWTLVPAGCSNKKSPWFGSLQAQGHEVSGWGERWRFVPLWTLAGRGEEITVLRLSAAGTELAFGDRRGACVVYRPDVASAESGASGSTGSGIALEIRELRQQGICVEAFWEGLRSASADIYQSKSQKRAWQDQDDDDEEDLDDHIGDSKTDSGINVLAKGPRLRDDWPLLLIRSLGRGHLPFQRDWCRQGGGIFKAMAARYLRPALVAIIVSVLSPGGEVSKEKPADSFQFDEPVLGDEAETALAGWDNWMASLDADVDWAMFWKGAESAAAGSTRFAGVALDEGWLQAQIQERGRALLYASSKTTGTSGAANSGGT